jgi:hypothetical protein
MIISDLGTRERCAKCGQSPHANGQPIIGTAIDSQGSQ